MEDTGFQIRAAGRQDADALFSLFAEVQALHAEAEPAFFRPPERDATFDEYLDEILDHPDQYILLACRDGVAVGYIHYYLGQRPKNIYQPERRVAYIHTLVVAREQRRTGCGSLIIEQVMHAARRAQAGLLGIDFWTFNHAARACFEKAGFKVNKEFMSLVL